MRRVHLWERGHPTANIDIVRRAAVDLATFAVDGARGRAVGDPVHEWVTEGRRAQWERAHAAGAKWARGTPYSSCGDLAHWMLVMLGCRDERIVNRGDDGGIIDWKPGPNITRLVKSPYYVTDGEPEAGDILHVASPDHVAVLLDRVSDDQWLTADYGQPYGQRRVCLVRNLSAGKMVRGRWLQGHVSLTRAVDVGAFTEAAIVPDGFAGGVEDDNPYVNGLRIPVGV